MRKFHYFTNPVFFYLVWAKEISIMSSGCLFNCILFFIFFIREKGLLTILLKGYLIFRT
jgi:hypothetical protein